VVFFQPRTLIVQPKQLDYRPNVLLAFDVITDPAGRGMQVVHGCFAGRDQLLSNSDGDGQIRKPVPVKVTDLPAANVEENHPASINVYSDVGPRTHFMLDLSGNGEPSHLSTGWVDE